MKEVMQSRLNTKHPGATRVSHWTEDNTCVVCCFESESLELPSEAFHSLAAGFEAH